MQRCDRSCFWRRRWPIYRSSCRYEKMKLRFENEKKNLQSSVLSPWFSVPDLCKILTCFARLNHFSYLWIPAANYITITNVNMSSSCIAKFYTNSNLNGVILALLASLSWSFFDLLSGLVRFVDGAIINIVIGATMVVICTAGITSVWNQVVRICNNSWSFLRIIKILTKIKLY